MPDKQTKFNARVGKQTPVGEHPLSLKFRPSEADTPRYAYAYRDVWGQDDLSKVIQDPYLKSYYLNACVDIIMESAGSVPIIVKEKKGDAWEPNEEHPLQTLLDYPNPFMSRRQLIMRVAGHTMLAGNALWVKNRAGSTSVKEIWPLNPDLVSIKPSRTEFIEHYKYGEGDTAVILNPLDVIHFTRINLANERWGEGYVKVGKKLFEMDNAAMEWNQTMLVQRGIYTNVLAVKHPLTQAQYDDLNAKIAARRLGGVQAGQDLVIGADVGVNRIGANAQEMDYINSRKLTRQDICMLMRVPPPMLSIYDDASLSNIGNARKIFYQDRIIPFLRGIEDALNMMLVPEFGDRNKLWITFDVEDLEAVQAVRFEKLKIMNTGVQSGISPRALNQELRLGFKDDDIIKGFLVSAKSDEKGEAIAPVIDPNKVPADPRAAGEAAEIETARGRNDPEAARARESDAKSLELRSKKAEKLTELYQKELILALKSLEKGDKNGQIPDVSDLAGSWFYAFFEDSELEVGEIRQIWEAEMRQKVAKLGEIRAICDQKSLDFVDVLTFTYAEWAKTRPNQLVETL